MDIGKLTHKQFAVLFNKLVSRVKEDPLTNFVQAPGFMNFTPSAAQEVILKVIFQKKLDTVEKKLVQIESTDADGKFCIIPMYMTEVQIYEYLTESTYDPERLETIKINKINLVCGRRAGKTTLAAIIAIYCAISNNWAPFLSTTPVATVLIMSHSREFSDEVLDIIKNFVANSEILTRLISKTRKQTASIFNLSMPYIVEGRIKRSNVQIKVGAASSKTTRGIAACAVLCDEIAYWNLDENMKETDVKILKAVRPALKQFGKLAMLIKLSSPGIKQGVLYNEYIANREGTLPSSYAVFKAPSWMMNTILPAAEFVEEWEYDEDGFDTEYRANFADSLSNFIVPEAIEMAVQRGVKFLAPSENREVKYFAAIDAAFKADRFTFTIVGVTDNRVTQYMSKGWKGTRKQPIKAHDVAEFVKNALKSFPVDYVAADQFAFQPLKEIFDQYSVTLQEYAFSPKYKKQIYFNLKKLIHSQQMDLLDSEIQTKELKELIVEQSNTGTIKIGHPAGGSDDFADSLAVAALHATEGQSTGKFTFEAAGAARDFGIKVDEQGRSIGAAPSPDMLVASGHLPPNVVDNSGMYVRDAETGKLRRRTEDDDGDDDGFQCSF